MIDARGRHKVEVSGWGQDVIVFVDVIVLVDVLVDVLVHVLVLVDVIDCP